MMIGATSAGMLLALTTLGIAPGFARDCATTCTGWQKVETDPYRLNNKQDAIAFADRTLGLYGNGTGRIYRTEDGGVNWRLVWRKPGTYVRTLEFVNDRTAYFPDVTDRQPLYVTHDAGSTWEPVVPQSGPPVAGLCALDVLKEQGRVLAIRAGGRVGGPAAMMVSSTAAPRGVRAI